MDFLEISKPFWSFAAPSILLVWGLGAGLALCATGRKRFATILLGIVTGCFVAMVFLPLGNWLLIPLEDKYPRGPWPTHVDGVLDLGGGLSGGILRARGLPGAETGESRLVATFELARHYPQARIVFSGGGGEGGETEVARYVFGQLGMDPQRITYENKSRDTWENFVFSRALVHPRPGEVWLLATSAYHMPRAMAVARRLGWTMVPWPTEYVTVSRPRENSLPFSTNLMHLDLAAHEWTGLLAYRLAGRTR